MLDEITRAVLSREEVARYLQGGHGESGRAARERIESYLARDRLAGDYDYFRLLELADIELWIASVEGFGRAPMSLAQRAY